MKAREHFHKGGHRRNGVGFGLLAAACTMLACSSGGAAPAVEAEPTATPLAAPAGPPDGHAWVIFGTFAVLLCLNVRRGRELPVWAPATAVLLAAAPFWTRVAVHLTAPALAAVLVALGWGALRGVSWRAPRFATLGELAAATGQERHGIEIDYDIFEDLRAPSPPDSSRPGQPYEAVSLDFRLKPGSKAVDAGVRLPNVNDGFNGRAPAAGSARAPSRSRCPRRRRHRAPAAGSRSATRTGSTTSGR